MKAIHYTVTVRFENGTTESVHFPASNPIHAASEVRRSWDIHKRMHDDDVRNGRKTGSWPEREIVAVALTDFR